MKPVEWRQKSVNFANNWVKENLPSLSVFPGTALRDLLINPFAEMTYKIWQGIQRIRGNMDVSENNESLDLAADVWFLPRNDSKYATMMWRIYFSEPCSVRIPAAGEVGSTSLRYFTNQAYNFSSSIMANNREGSEYYIQFPVISIGAGEDYNAPANTLSEIFFTLNAPWTRATNPTAGSGSATQETNAEYYARLMAGANTRQNLITAQSTQSTLQSEFPNFDTVNIQGFGDTEMDRDKVYGVSGPGGQAPYRVSDFYFREENGNIAREASSEVALPTLATLKLQPELDYEGYKEIAKADNLFFIRSGGSLSSDVFSASPVSFEIEGWYAGDSGLVPGQKKFGNSSYIKSNGLYLGVPTNEFVAVEVI